MLATIGAGVGAATNSRLYGETRRLYGEAREYLEQVDKVTDAAVSLESVEFGKGSLSAWPRRPDALGQLAKTFQRMAEEVVAREARLLAQVQELRIEIDEASIGEGRRDHRQRLLQGPPIESRRSSTDSQAGRRPGG